MLRGATAARRWIGAALLAALLAPALAAELPLSLHCARGAGEYPDAEIRRADGAGYVVHVTFVGYRPSRMRAEWSLRECLNTALKYDASRDMVALLWYRERRSPKREPILPGLVYRAASRTVTVEAAPGERTPAS